MRGTAALKSIEALYKEAETVIGDGVPMVAIVKSVPPMAKPDIPVAERPTAIPTNTQQIIPQLIIPQLIIPAQIQAKSPAPTLKLKHKPPSLTVLKCYAQWPPSSKRIKLALTQITMIRHLYPLRQTIFLAILLTLPLLMLPLLVL